MQFETIVYILYVSDKLLHGLAVTFLKAIYTELTSQLKMSEAGAVSEPCFSR